MGIISFGLCVSGGHINLHIPPDNMRCDPSNMKRKHRLRLSGKVGFSVNPKKLRVLWYDASTKNCMARKLK